MPQPRNEQRSCKKPQSKHKLASFPDSTESTSNKYPKKKKFLFVKLKGLGCKGTSPPPASTPAIIRSAAVWETRNEKQRRRNQRNPGNVVVDVPDVCCTPPGIGIASDFAPANRRTAPRKNPKHKFELGSRGARRNQDDSTPDFPAVLSTGIGPRINRRSAGEIIAAVLSNGIGPRINRRSAGEIIEMMMFEQTLVPARIFRGNDEYRGWRLNVDDMSYEELLDLSDKIGYVGSGLQEQEISSYIRKFNISNPLLTRHKDWNCSICQEKVGRNDDIGTLHCGHHHHVQCIKQWLLLKNQCPVCKSVVVAYQG